MNIFFYLFEQALETSPLVRRIFDMPVPQLQAVLNVLCVRAADKADISGDDDDEASLEKWSWQTSAESVAKGFFFFFLYF